MLSFSEGCLAFVSPSLCLLRSLFHFRALAVCLSTGICASVSATNIPWDREWSTHVSLGFRVLASLGVLGSLMVFSRIPNLLDVASARRNVRKQG